MIPVLILVEGLIVLVPSPTALTSGYQPVVLLPVICRCQQTLKITTQPAGTGPQLRIRSIGGPLINPSGDAPWAAGGLCVGRACTIM